MKRFVLMLCTLIGVLSIKCNAQEVRGVSSRLVKYTDGLEYEYATGRKYDRYGFNGYYTSKSTEYYGWELCNHNSCTVSVDIELWYLDDKKPLKTKSIILKSGEIYIFKAEDINFWRKDREGASGHTNRYWDNALTNIDLCNTAVMPIIEGNPHYRVKDFNITYKAYKLE